jgi:hypothetical protein
MAERLLERFAEDARRASRWAPPDDPFPVLEALGYAVVLHLVGGLDAVPADARAAVLAASKAALDAAATFDTDEADDADAYARACRLAALGARLLAGEAAGALDGLPADAIDPTDRRIVRMLGGELDGISAAACAVRCLRRDDPRPRLLWSIAARAAEAEADEPLRAIGNDGAGVDEARRAHITAPLRLAAADPAPIRPPDEGRFVGALEDTLLEAVFFPAERQLAVYAATPAFLQVLAPGLTPKDVKPGYFLGQLAPEVGETLDLEVRVGDRSFRWGLSIG